jgi:glycosyl transferase, family 25
MTAVIPVARIINLDSSPDRLIGVTARLDAAGLRWQRHRAIAAASTEIARAHPLYRGHRVRAMYSRDLSRGEIGCFLSHLDAMRMFMAGDDPLALILEDDAVPSPGAARALGALSGWLINHGPGMSVSVIHLSRTEGKWQRPLTEVGGYRLIRTFRPPLIFSAMLWTRAGVAAFQAHVERSGIDRPVDDAFRACFARSGTAAALVEPVFSEDGSASTINHALHRVSGLTKVARMRRKLPDYAGAVFNMLRRR